MVKEEVKETDMVMDSCWCIARETSESVYIWDIEGVRKMEIADNRNSEKLS